MLQGMWSQEVAGEVMIKSKSKVAHIDPVHEHCHLVRIGSVTPLQILAGSGVCFGMTAFSSGI